MQRRRINGDGHTVSSLEFRLAKGYPRKSAESVSSVVYSALAIRFSQTHILGDNSKQSPAS